MAQRESDTTRRLACRRCDYTTDVVRSSCPECGGDMMYATEG
ncbi:hypothetical protein [Haloarcula litorea]|nr:hypothetical protein [Halomicroarcula sp. GDY20]